MVGSDYTFIRKRCAERATRLFDEFDRRRKGILLEVAREFYPLGVAGLTKNVETIADECPYDEDHRLLTTKPVDCLRKGAAGFHGNLTSPARRWFKLRLPSFASDSDSGTATQEQTATLDRLTDAVEWAMSRGNVYASLYKVYEHCLAFGFACMLVTGDRDRIVKARTLRVGTYALGVEEGEVCRVARRFSWTAEQIVREFGDAGCSDRVRDAAKKGDAKTRFTVYNLIEPNATGYLREYDEVAKRLALDEDIVYRSVYWLEAANDDDPQGGVLKISGFTVKPIVAPRMDLELGDTYGRGRGMDGLDLARGVQSLQYDIYQVSGTNAQPAVVASSEFKADGLKLGRGQINYAPFGDSRNALVMPVLAQAPSSAETRQDRQDAEQELADLFFNTAFATIDALKTQRGVKTATEIDALVRENMERLNPVVTNFDKELLDPLVSIVTHYAIAAGIVPLTPEDAAALSTVNVEYVSQIHMAARQSQIGAIDTWIGKVGAIAQAKPEIADNMNADGIAAKYAELLGVPAACRTAEREVAAVRAQRQEAMDRENQMRQVEMTAKAARDAGAVPTDEEHLAGRILQGMGAQ